MELNRKPTIQEQQLLEILISKSSIPVYPDWEVRMLVRSMNDGGMGSLYLFPDGEIIENRIFGKQISDFQFTDIDGVDVIASLNIDSNGKLFELDIWKFNFGKLLSLKNISLRPCDE